MKIKSVRLIAAPALALLLTACSFSQNTVIATRFMTKQEKLDNGKPLTIGMIRPTSEWNCDQVATNNAFKWSAMQFEGQFTSLSGGYGLLSKKILAYANEKKIKANYAVYSIPDTKSINGISISALEGSDAVSVIYYQCGKVMA